MSEQPDRPPARGTLVRLSDVSVGSNVPFHTRM